MAQKGRLKEQRKEGGHGIIIPKGALNKSTLIAKELVEGQAEALMDRAVKNALLGLDPRLLRFLVQWLLPQGREEAPPEIEARLADLEGRVKALEQQT